MFYDCTDATRTKFKRPPTKPPQTKFKSPRPTPISTGRGRDMLWGQGELDRDPAVTAALYGTNLNRHDIAFMNRI